MSMDFMVHRTSRSTLHRNEQLLRRLFNENGL